MQPVPRSEAAWLAPLSEAYEQPWRVAERWRRSGGRIVGVLGRLVPRELVLAAGMLPIRLSARRLTPGDEPLAELHEGLADELSPETAEFLRVLLGGGLDWIDALIVGRDTEAYTKLFYVLRELAGESAGTAVPPFAFCDLLRQPLRTSARYNRLRVRQLLAQVAGWSGREVTDEDLATAVAQERAVASALQQLDDLRTRGLVSGRDALLAAGGAQSLSTADTRAALGLLPQGGGRADAVERPRLWLTGSGQDDAWAYERLEAEGVLVVGEDHGWGDDGREYPAITRDPLDGIVDRHQFSRRGSARSGLDRVDAVVAAIVESRADGVLSLSFDHDEASGWELPRLRGRLDPIPVAQATIPYRGRDDRPLRQALAGLVGGGGAGA